MTMNRSLRFLTALAVFVTAVAMYSCSEKNNSESDQPELYHIPDSVWKAMVFDTVTESRVSTSLRFNGTVDFNQEKVINVFPLVSGVLSGANVLLGDFVRAGQVLGVVNSAEVANYNGTLATAEAAVRQAERQLAQQQQLYKDSLASQVDVVNAEAALQQAQAAKVAAERVLAVNGNDREGKMVLRSPIDGYVVQKNVTNGMSIRPDNSNALYTISDLKQVWVQANVYEANIGKVHLGDPVEVTTLSYPDRVFHGRIDRLMKPQMFATVLVGEQQEKKALSISKSALIFDHSEYYVLVCKGRDDVRIRKVDLLDQNGNLAFIKSGLQPGEVLLGAQAILIYNELNK
jgi:membrane fusion protein, heavy metal efflux system